MKSAIIFGLMLIALAGNGRANAVTYGDQPFNCSVANASKLPADLTPDAVCKAIRTAAVRALTGLDEEAIEVSVDVTVLSNASIAATATVSGKRLPQQRVATSDRPLNPSAIAMLARAVARGIAEQRQSRGA